MKKKHVKILRIVMLIITAICIIIFPPWSIVRAWITPLPDTVQEQLNQSIDSFDFDGMIAYVSKSSGNAELFTSGWHNRAKKIPAFPEALFKIASINKLYDVVAITKLVKNNRLSLDNSLGHYFPELRNKIEFADEITLRMIVRHRSGIPNFTNSPNYWADPPDSSEGALELIFGQPASFIPDSDYEYSNTNYLLIHMLIEKVVGYSKHQFIREEILEPLNLKNTYGSINDINMDSLMSGYYVGIESDVKAANYGSMIATAEDVGIFIRALNDGSVFENGELEIYSSLYMFEHSGLLPGYQSVARYDKKSGIVAVLFVNTTDFNTYLFTISEIICNRIINIAKKE